MKKWEQERDNERSLKGKDKGSDRGRLLIF